MISKEKVMEMMDALGFDAEDRFIQPQDFETQLEAYGVDIQDFTGEAGGLFGTPSWGLPGRLRLAEFVKGGEDEDGAPWLLFAFYDGYPKPLHGYLYFAEDEAGELHPYDLQIFY